MIKTNFCEFSKSKRWVGSYRTFGFTFSVFVINSCRFQLKFRSFHIRNNMWAHMLDIIKSDNCCHVKTISIFSELCYPLKKSNWRRLRTSFPSCQPRHNPFSSLKLKIYILTFRHVWRERNVGRKETSIWSIHFAS